MAGKGFPRRPCTETRHVIASIGFLASFAFMSDRSPPFTALRAVEAASRHRSFTGAAPPTPEVMKAVDTCVLLNQWDLAVDLANKHNFVQIESLLEKSAALALPSGCSVLAHNFP